MKQLDINTFHDFSDEEISRRILMEDPVMRVVLVSLRAGQALPEHAANGLVTVYSVGGRVLFYERTECCDMVPGTLIRLAPGRPHRLEAKEDSRLLVTMIKQSDPSAWNALAPRGRTLDLRQTPRERRHSTVFYAFTGQDRLPQRLGRPAFSSPVAGCDRALLIGAAPPASPRGRDSSHKPRSRSDL